MCEKCININILRVTLSTDKYILCVYINILENPCYCIKINKSWLSLKSFNIIVSLLNPFITKLFYVQKCQTRSNPPANSIRAGLFNYVKTYTVL